MFTRRMFGSLMLMLVPASFASVRAQQPQVPTLQVCNQTSVSGQALVRINSRSDAVSSGRFQVAITLRCDSTQNPYPTGTLQITGISMSDSTVGGTITGTTFEQVTTTGKHTPTVFLNGRCRADGVNGCRFWMMIADNTQTSGQGTPDVVSFLVVDGTGKRVAYGTGPAVTGNITVQSTSN